MNLYCHNVSNKFSINNIRISSYLIRYQIDISLDFGLHYQICFDELSFDTLHQ